MTLIGSVKIVVARNRLGFDDSIFDLVLLRSILPLNARRPVVGEAIDFIERRRAYERVKRVVLQTF